MIARCTCMNASNVLNKPHPIPAKGCRKTWSPALLRQKIGRSWLEFKFGDHFNTSLVQNVDALRLVSAHKAKTVIIMDPDHGNRGQVCFTLNMFRTMVGRA